MEEVWCGRMKLKIGICDSDRDWHEKLGKILEGEEYIHCVPNEIKHFYGEKELLMFSEDPLDVLFMDVKLKDGNGISLAGKINNLWPECQIIYATDSLVYAVEAYQTEHSYYILKDQIANLIDRVLERTFERVISGRRRRKKIMLSVIKGDQILLSPQEILYFERRKRVTIAVTTVGNYQVWDKLDSLERILFPDEFIRCHTSYIVYLPAVRVVEASSVLMRDGSWVPISRGYLKEVRKKFELWSRTHVMTVREAEA